MRLIISQITNLWKLPIKVEPVGEIKKDVKEGKADKDKDKDKEKEKDKDGQAEDNYWKPWSHIWPKEKSKGCVYNPGGKYCVRIYWMVGPVDTWWEGSLGRCVLLAGQLVKIYWMIGGVSEQ